MKRLALLDIVSTRAVYDEGGTALAVRYFHWYFLVQPRPLPERMIGADPAAWLEDFLPDKTRLQEHLRTFGTAAGIHATCEDCRAGFAIDLPHDRADVAAGRKIDCPTTGEAIDCGHFIPEERPTETVRALSRFFRP